MTSTADSGRGAIPTNQWQYLRAGFALEAGDAASRVQLGLRDAVEERWGHDADVPPDREGLRQDAMHAVGYLADFGRWVLEEDPEEAYNHLLLMAAAEAALPLWKALAERGAWRYEPKEGARESVLRTLDEEQAKKIRRLARRVIKSGSAVDAPVRQFVATVHAHLGELAEELRAAGEEELAQMVREVEENLGRRTAVLEDTVELWRSFQASRSTKTRAMADSAES